METIVDGSYKWSKAEKTDLGCPLPVDTPTTQPREHTGRGSEKLLKARGPGFLLQCFLYEKDKLYP